MNRSRDRFVRRFSGVLGIGQGAALTALLPFLSLYGLELDGLKFMILCNGYTINFSRAASHFLSESDMLKGLSEIFDPTQQMSTLEKECRIRTLHLIASNQCKQKGLKLAEYFRQCDIHRYVGDYRFPPCHANEFNIIGRWSVRRRKEEISALSSTHSALLIENQTKLSLLEDYSAQFVANTIASNPPKALMAIIAPDAVGGWTGRKERCTEDGGGAPCPEGFLISREKRKHVDGENSCSKEATRIHPNISK